MSVPNAAHGDETPPLPVQGRSHIRLHSRLGDGPWRCAYCNAELICPCLAGVDNFTFWRDRNLHTRGATVDHVVPTSRGGADDDANTVASCMACNSAKNWRIFPDEWFPGHDAATWVIGGDLPDRPGDGLLTLGLTALLRKLPRGERTHLADVAELVGEGPAFIRNRLDEFYNDGRISRIVRPSPTTGYERIYGWAAS